MSLLRGARRAPALAFVVLAAGAALSTQARRPKAPPPEAILVPGTESRTAPYSVTGQAIELNSNGVLVRAEPLDETRRASWFALRTPLAHDPLPGREAWPDGFAVFELGISNRSSQQVRYNPMTTICWTTKDHELRRLQLDQVLDILRAGLDPISSPDASAMARLAIAHFHLEPVILEPGQRVSRLLVFKGDPRARSLRLDLHRVEVAGTALQPRFYFDVLRDD